MTKPARFVAEGAGIAALYVVLTLLANAFGLANYAIQVRFSEALCVLPFFTPSAVWGLTGGCVLANFLTGCDPLDILFGSLATLVGAVILYFMGRLFKGKATLPVYALAPLPNVVANTITVPLILTYVYHLEDGLAYLMLTVGAGELISCYLLGIPLMIALVKHRAILFGGEQ